MLLQVGFRNDADAFFQFAITNAAMSVALNSFGHMLVAVSPSVDVAGIFMGLAITMFSLVTGFYIPYPSTPRGWLWFYWANPTSHAFRGT